MRDSVDFTSICPLPESARTHGERILPLAQSVASLFGGNPPAKLSRPITDAITKWLDITEQYESWGGVNFSRTQAADICRAYVAGVSIEFETMGPYLADYPGGVIHARNLTPADAIGLRLAQVLRRWFPRARLVSLYDDVYAPAAPGGERPEFSPGDVARFRANLVRLYRSAGVAGPDPLLIPESSMVPQAELLVDALAERGYIERSGEAVRFVNPACENPLYRRISLRTSGGRWLCVALDAATFRSADNLRIAHIVALPIFFKVQQDQVWEILRVLGIRPVNYHNMFYDPTLGPELVARTVSQALAPNCLV